MYCLLQTSQVEPTIVLLLFQSPKIGLNSKLHVDCHDALVCTLHISIDMSIFSGTSSTGSREEYIARLDVEIDSAQQGGLES